MPSPTPPCVDESFVEVPVRGRFFQSSAFFPMPVVLISTTAPSGQTNLAPYSHCFPHLSEGRHSLMLVTRSSSKTAQNIERTGRCVINFVPDHPAYLANVRVLGRPAETDEKMTKSIFTLEAITPAEGDDGGSPYPEAVREAVQSFVCRWDSSHPQQTGQQERQYLLEVERVLMKERWRDALDAGKGAPRLPVDYGFRQATSSWMSRPRADVSGPRLRPRFEIVCVRGQQELVELFKEDLSRPDCEVTGRIAGEHVQLTIREEDRRFWTPSMDIRVEQHEEGSLIRGRIGPQPSVWQMFTGLHLLIAFCGIGGLMYGISQAMTGESPWGLWAIPIALFLHAFIAGAAFIGQGLGADETYKLRTFLDDVLSR
ncbi:MAG: hypothetical protein CSA66_04410 [Proteobacteria bacterium]|nr:MAG: hypothetical protein CSA66_04410 [Pseudomonadota bacterium]